MAATSAAMELENIHPVRLGLALNFAVLYNDVMQMPQPACQIITSVLVISVVVARH